MGFALPPTKTGAMAVYSVVIVPFCSKPIPRVLLAKIFIAKATLGVTAVA